jgi:hypothetical protein
MALSPSLQRKLQEVLGAQAAADLVSMLEDLDTSRGDVGELRHEMQLGFARIDARFEQINAGIEKALREQTRFFFVAWAVILAAIIGMYARQ